MYMCPSTVLYLSVCYLEQVTMFMSMFITPFFKEVGTLHTRVRKAYIEAATTLPSGSVNG